MKIRINRIGIYIFFLMAFAMGACKKKFLDRPPKDAIVNDNFWNNESDIKLFLNGMYGDHIWGHNQEPSRAPLNFRGSHIAYGDAYTDNATYKGTDVNVRMTEAYVVPLNNDANGWDWDGIRKINFFLSNYQKAKGTEDALRAYAAEAYFFKAWAYFRKVQIFGDVPWLVTDLNTESPELYAPKTPRKTVMDSVLMCINRAIEWLPESAQREPTGRINKDKAQFLKARICLYEGTFRKYHTELGLQTSAVAWLEEAEKAAKYLIDSKRYSLYNTGATSYYALFAQRDAVINSNPEAILAKEYSTSLTIAHDLTRYYQQNNHLGLCAQKSLVDEYLCADGRPIYISGTKGSFVQNPLFLGYGKWTELDNRDPRITQTITRPGEYWTIFNQSTGTSDIKTNGITYPRIGFTDMEQSGYRFAKHWLGAKDLIDNASGSTQAAIEFRYAEALLIYAEAKTESGTISQADIDITINQLRQRAGFDFVEYPTAKLTMGNEPDDPRLDAIYMEKLGYALPKLIREIRRERRIELVLEDLRYTDLMRWKAGALLTVPMRGMKFTQELQALYNGSFSNGKVNPATGIKEIAKKATLNAEVFVDSEGFIILKPKSSNIINGTLPWSDYMYYWPVPKGELVLNKQLKQTPGWENK